MVRRMAFVLISSLLLVSCGGENKNTSPSDTTNESDRLYNQVLALHDTLMIDWTVIQKLQVALNEPIDSALVLQHDSLITSTKITLKRAYEFMHRWMEDFEMPLRRYTVLLLLPLVPDHQAVYM